MKDSLAKELFFVEKSNNFNTGYSTKIGGVNEKWGFNLGYNTNEKSHEIDLNRERYKELLGKGLNFSFANQIHSSKVLEVSKSGTYDDVDGFVTREKGLVLNILTADCLAVIACDKEKEIIGAFHAGWRGTAEKISVNGINMMLEMGADKKNISVYINPGIKVKSYKVGEELLKYFPEDSFVRNGKDLFFDLEKENIRQLKELGIKKIKSSPYCTFCDEKLYSYRRDGVRAGRFASFIYLI